MKKISNKKLFLKKKKKVVRRGIKVVGVGHSERTTAESATSTTVCNLGQGMQEKHNKGKVFVS